jgi:hypothetical protein
VIEVEGLESAYNVITDLDVLQIPLTASSNIKGADFEYIWAVYETNSQGYIPTFDTISREKDLNFPITLPARGYRLVSIVTNKKTGLSKYTSAVLNVNTEYTRGWYVLKDDGDNSDLDQFLTPDNIVPDNVNANVFSELNGFKIEGTGTLLTYASDYKTTVASASPTNTKTLFVGTTKNVSAIFINTLKQIRDRKDIFFGGEAEGGKDMVVFGASQSINLINNSHIYGIYTMTANSGIFGTYAMRDDYNTAYSLSPYYFSDTRMNSYLFDNTSSSFVSAGPGATVLTNITDIAETKMPAQNNNKKALYLGYQRYEYDPVNYKNLNKGWGLFEDKDDPNLKILTYLEPDGFKMQITCDTLELSDKLFNSSLHTLLVSTAQVSAENMMYFVHDNKDVYSRNLSNGNEQLQFSVPVGEEVTFIRHRSYTESGYAFNYVMIGTKVGSHYKIRMFEKTAGNLRAEPKFVLEGEGAPRDIMYVSPSVGTATYPTGY